MSSVIFIPSDGSAGVTTAQMTKAINKEAVIRSSADTVLSGRVSVLEGELNQNVSTSGNPTFSSVNTPMVRSTGDTLAFNVAGGFTGQQLTWIAPQCLLNFGGDNPTDHNDLTVGGIHSGGGLGISNGQFDDPSLGGGLNISDWSNQGSSFTSNGTVYMSGVSGIFLDGISSTITLNGSDVLLNQAQGTAINSVVRKDYVDGLLSTLPATSTNTINTLAKRDALGNFSMNDLTLHSITGSSGTFNQLNVGVVVGKAGGTITLSGSDVLLNQAQGTAINSVVRKDYVDSAVTTVAGTSTNTINTLVKRDNLGNFSMNDLTFRRLNCSNGDSLGFFGDVGSNANLYLGRLAGNLSSVGNGRLTVIGTNAMANSKDNISDCVAMGWNSMLSASGCNHCVGIGSEALRYNLGGNDNVSIGYSSGWNVGSGNQNVSIGSYALGYDVAPLPTSCGQNICIGTYAGYKTRSTYNTFIGNNAGQNNLTGNFNFALGASALSSLTGSDSNLAIGVSCLQSLGRGGGNVCIGGPTSSPLSADNLTAVGYNVWIANNNSTNNTCIGAFAEIDSGNDGVVIGAGAKSAVGGSNTVIGRSALAQSSANNSCAIGYQATVSSANTIQLGNSSVTSVNTSATITGNIINSASNKFQSNGTTILDTSGTNNTRLGAAAGNGITTGIANVLLGNSAGASITSETEVTAVGSSCGQDAGSSDTLIGAGAHSQPAPTYVAPAKSGDNISIGSNSSSVSTMLNNSGGSWNLSSGGQLTIASNAHPILLNTSASAGTGAALPSLPQCYLHLLVNDVQYRLPLYKP